MIGAILAFMLTIGGKWRWLGFAFLLEMIVVATIELLRNHPVFDPVFLVVLPITELVAGWGVGMLWHRWRRGDWPRDRSIDRMVPIRRGLDRQGQETLYWEVESAALTPQLARLFSVIFVVLFVVAALGSALLNGGDIRQAIEIAGALAALVALGFGFVLFVLLFNRLRRAYLLTDDTYVVALSDPRLLAGPAGALRRGLATRTSPSIAAYLEAAVRRGAGHAWSNVANIDCDPEHGRIRLNLKKGAFFGRDTIMCHGEGYAAACAWIARHVGSSEPGCIPPGERVEM